MRPQPPRPPALLDSLEPGPFVERHEHLTPGEVWALREPGSAANSPGWRVRVVPNLYPALRVEHSATGAAEGPAERMGGMGAHEVIIEDPSRDEDLTTLPVDRVAEILAAWQARLADLRGDGRLVCGVVFRHRGADAGATVAHPHSQLLALPFVPPRLAAEVRAGLAYHAQHGACALCDTLAHERQAGVRMVAGDEEGAAVWAPFASRVPYELVVAPAAHHAALEDAAPAVLRSLAAGLKTALTRLDAHLGKPALQIWLRSSPWRLSLAEKASYHLHLCVLPVMNRLGGLESGFGLHINTVNPEEVARALRG